MLQVDVTSLRKWSGGSARLHTLEQWFKHAARGPRVACEEVL